MCPYLQQYYCTVISSETSFRHFGNVHAILCFWCIYTAEIIIRSFIWESGWAYALNVASLLCSAMSEQSERGCTSLPLQRLWKCRQRSGPVGVWCRLNGTGHTPVLRVLSVPILWWESVSVLLTLWQKYYRLIPCLDDFQKGPYAPELMS